MLSEKSLLAAGGVVLGANQQAAPVGNRASPVRMDAFYAEPITMESFMGATPAHNAQMAGTGKRTRQGVNQHYKTVCGGLKPTAVCQLCGDAGLTIKQAGEVLLLLGWENVNGNTISTATRDGATHGFKKDGGVYKDYKVPQIMQRLTAEQQQVLQDAMLFVRTASPAVA